MRRSNSASSAWASGAAMALRFLSFFLLGDEATRALAAEYEPVRDDRTMVDYSIPRFVGSGFGFSLYTYRVGSPEDNPTQVMQTRFQEYASWGDSAERIISGPAQAELVNRAIALRQEGGPAMGRLRKKPRASANP